MGRRLAPLLALVLAVAACGGSASAPSPAVEEQPSTTSVTSATSSSIVASTLAGTALSYVAFGDSWGEGAHCNGCRPFPMLWLDYLQEQTGAEVEFTNFTGVREASDAEGKGSASLLASIQNDEATQNAVRAADIILIETGGNEGGDAMEQVIAGSCGGADGFDCIRSLGEMWSANFDEILTEIKALREGQPTAIRLVNAANAFLSVPEMNEGMPTDFAMTGGALAFELLTAAMCDAAATHDAVCVDVRPVLNGPGMDQPVDENSQESMQAVADALAATGLPELDLGSASASQGDLAALFDIGEGRELFLECIGEGSPVIVIEVGNEDTVPWSWTEVFTPMSAVSRVCAYDRANLGRSDPDPGPRTIVDVADDLVTLLTVAQVPGPYVFVGGSYGGNVVTVLAANHPDQVAGLVLVDAEPAHRPAQNPLRINLTDEQYAACCGDFQFPPYDDPANPEHIDFEGGLEAEFASLSNLPQVPTTVLTATHCDDCPSDWPTEAIMDSSAELQAEWIKDNPLGKQILVESGHVMQREAPDAIVDATRDIVEQLRNG